MKTSFYEPMICEESCFFLQKTNLFPLSISIKVQNLNFESRSTTMRFIKYQSKFTVINPLSWPTASFPPKASNARDLTGDL